jgi:Flp pilus assembly protein TadG
MLVKAMMTSSARAMFRRNGVAAVEFALCMPLLTTIMLGLWEVGRMTEVQMVMWNSAREASRDASLGQDNLSTVASKLLTYLSAAEPTAFPPSHSTSMIAPVITLSANTTGYTCWDNTANQEMFTVTFADFTTPSVTDPTGMSQLDRFEIVVSVPYASIAWSPLAQITGVTRLYVAVDWVCMIDSPFQISPYLPAE